MQILVTTATTVGGVLFQAGDLILHREHEMLDYFGRFLSQIYALLVPFLQAYTVWRCTKIYKYHVCDRGGPIGL